MTSTLIRNVVVCALAMLCAALVGCSSDDGKSADLQRQLDMRAEISPEDLAELQKELGAFRMAQREKEQREQERRNAQTMAGLEGGLAQSPQPPVYAASDQETLASLLPGGEAAFSPLSSAIRRAYPGTNRGVAQSALGAAYVKSVSSDGEGGFHVSYVIDGEEALIHFAADQYRPMYFDFQDSKEDTEFYFWSWTDSFSGDPDDPDLTDGSTFFDYFDFHGWAYEGSGEGRRGALAYGARTMPANLPMGSATYQGYMVAEWWRADNPDWGSNRYLEGDLTLEASLDNMEISGRIDGIRTPSWATDSGESAPLDASNSIAIATTAIDQAWFNADWAGNGPMDAAPGETFHGFTGTILGEFYGPAAEEVGGVLSGSRAATDTAPEQLLVGGFGASQPDPEP